ncbi:MAG TPA: FKBP-type peptidyl-prolyl cis-trans isomerase [Candidatus Saccharimonadales bacterium]|nr:FKBP-type peptidyl-prolyl cis-trans isomerase [Candidatus Saccharimonadales bacterium]
MQESHTKKSTRIIIWVIAIVMAVGAVGSYFVIILQNNDAQKQQNNPQTNISQQTQQPTPVDQTAFKVEGKVTELQKTDLKEGNGKEAGPNDLVRMHYKGTIAQTGAKFDSSYDRGEPLTCTLKGLIVGWQQGVPGMKEGGKRRLVIPASLAYGAQERPGIPANSDLVFEVELLAVNPEGGVDACAQ